MININIGLAYIHDALKRQAENRQYGIMQGLGFMQSYYEARSIDTRAEERQEAHYNMARTYHLLGLVHIAIPFYRKVFAEVDNLPQGKAGERLVVDAAYN